MFVCQLLPRHARRVGRRRRRARRSRADERGGRARARRPQRAARRCLPQGARARARPERVRCDAAHVAGRRRHLHRAVRFSVFGLSAFGSWRVVVAAALACARAQPLLARAARPCLLIAWVCPRPRSGLLHRVVARVRLPTDQSPPDRRRRPPRRSPRDDGDHDDAVMLMTTGTSSRRTPGCSRTAKTTRRSSSATGPASARRPASEPSGLPPAFAARRVHPAARPRRPVARVRHPSALLPSSCLFHRGVVAGCEFSRFLDPLDDRPSTTAHAMRPFPSPGSAVRAGEPARRLVHNSCRSRTSLGLHRLSMQAQPPLQGWLGMGLLSHYLSSSVAAGWLLVSLLWC